MRKHWAFGIFHTFLSPLFWWARETEYAGKTHKPGKLPTNSHFRNQENNLLLYYIMLWQCSDKSEMPQDRNITKQKHPLTVAKSDSCSYFSVLLCCGVWWASDPSLLTEAATVDIVSASSLFLWCSAIKASSCFLLRRNSSLRISCLLISDHNCFQ